MKRVGHCSWRALVALAAACFGTVAWAGEGAEQACLSERTACRDHAYRQGQAEVLMLNRGAEHPITSQEITAHMQRDRDRLAVCEHAYESCRDQGAPAGPGPFQKSGLNTSKTGAKSLK